MLWRISKKLHIEPWYLEDADVLLAQTPDCSGAGESGPPIKLLVYGTQQTEMLRNEMNEISAGSQGTRKCFTGPNSMPWQNNLCINFRSWWDVNMDKGRTKQLWMQTWFDKGTHASCVVQHGSTASFQRKCGDAQRSPTGTSAPGPFFGWALIIPAATLDSWNGAHYQGLWGDSTTFDLPRSQDISSLWKNHPSPTPYQHSTLWTSLRSSSISASMPVRLNVLVARCHIGRVTGTEPECDTMYVLNCFD